jgi:anaerobic selenocysteine-containing dehydrogenase
VAEELAQVRRGGQIDADFPFRLTSRRQLESMNSAYTNASRTRLRYPVNPAFMNPQDMEAQGIIEGDSVEISSAHGTVVAIARRDSSLRRGVISMTHAWGAPDPAADPRGTRGAFVGRLISLEKDLESINYMPRQSAIPVAVRHSRNLVTEASAGASSPP